MSRYACHAVCTGMYRGKAGAGVGAGQGDCPLCKRSGARELRRPEPARLPCRLAVQSAYAFIGIRCGRAETLAVLHEQP